MLSKKMKYALKALIFLAREGAEKPVLISDIAEKEGIPKKFLEAILLELKNKGVLESRKGKGGGYLLGKIPKEIKLGEVMRALDGPIAPLPCLSRTAYAKCDECEDEKTCGIRLIMKEVYEANIKILDSTSLADILDRTDSVLQQERKILMYHI